MLSVLLCCAAIFAVTSARPDGAPLQACDSLMPMGPHVANNNMEQATPTPWTIDICNFNEVGGVYQYTPGGTYNITLMQDPNVVAVPLRGFLVIGRTVSDGSMVGTFADPSAANSVTQLSLCSPNNVGVTHNNAARADQTGPFTFTWTAPSAGTGAVEFRYAIVRNVLTWWANDASAMIQEAGNVNGASNLQGMGFWTLLVAAVSVAVKTVL